MGCLSGVHAQRTFLGNQEHLVGRSDKGQVEVPVLSIGALSGLGQMRYSSPSASSRTQKSLESMSLVPASTGTRRARAVSLPRRRSLNRATGNPTDGSRRDADTS